METTLRSGKELQVRKEAEKKTKQTNDEAESENHNQVNSEKRHEKTELTYESQQLKGQTELISQEKKNKEVRIYHPPIPFPERLKQTTLDGQFAKFLNMFKKLEINIPFVEALAEMPHYAKFMKKIISKKGKLDENGIISLSPKYSTIIQKNLPNKMQDPRSFTIPCTIGNHEFGKALCDFGASINLMPLSVVKRLSLGELNPTTLSL